jgi:hypothetical protein
LKWQRRLFGFMPAGQELLLAEADCREIAYHYEQAAGDSGTFAVLPRFSTVRIEFHREEKLLHRRRKLQFKKTLMRQMIWIKTHRMEAWGCSECEWTFEPSGPPRGSDLDEMKQNYERQREKEYASHACFDHPRAGHSRAGSRIQTCPDDRPHARIPASVAP